MNVYSCLEGTWAIAEFEGGSPTVIMNHYGKCMSLLFGSLPIREASYQDDGLSKLLGNFVTLSGVLPPAVIDSRGSRIIDAKLLTNGRESLLIVLNSEDKDYKILISLHSGEYRMVCDLMTEEEISIESLEA